ncbi:MAG: FKBP-type peptidyl-prolyl cis-trans isomerase [Alistipes putredinis]|nr:MAG: FKBP-type peptidyl-prolyl cis-trans isomerase [Alistipes putredinis]
MTQDQAYEFLNEYFMVRIPARNLKASEEFLNDIAKNNPNIKRTDSGLLYEIILEGDAEVIAKNDKDEVMVNYKGTLKDGKVFDENDSTKFSLNRVIRGWSEGMKLVGKGGKIKLYVPSDLGYGVQGQSLRRHSSQRGSRVRRRGYRCYPRSRVRHCARQKKSKSRPFHFGRLYTGIFGFVRHFSNFCRKLHINNNYEIRDYKDRKRRYESGALCQGDSHYGQ